MKKKRKNMLVYLVGHKGWIGQQFINYFQHSNIPVTFSESNIRAETDELCHEIKNIKNITNNKVTHVLCCSGRTHGSIGEKKYTTIDYLQHPETLQQNLNDNLYVPLKLAQFCEKESIHFTYIGTGCIYTYQDDKKIFSEEDVPNFFGSNYSIVKGMTNNLIKNMNCLHLRIRMPITSDNNPRNFITKILNYEKICSVPNSMSVLDELIPIACHMMMENIQGTFNFTNPGVIEHNQILEMYKNEVDETYTWKNFSIEEQDSILLSKRSNNHLDTAKLEKVVEKLKEKYSFLEFNTIHDAVLNCIKMFTKYKKKKMYFLSSNGLDMLRNIPNEFSKNFDWVVTESELHKFKEVPETIYIKVDFLPFFVNNVLPMITNNFTLITSCSDYSPSVNFTTEYNIIINHPLLLCWYASNKIHEHEKIKPFPQGLCCYPESFHNFLLKLNKESINISKKDKILCCWRDRESNICGSEYVTRNQTKKFILEYPNIFDWIEPTLSNEEFTIIMSTYKYVLCPVGNGVDPSPKSFEAIAVNTIPIFIKTSNTVDFYETMPCILVNSYEEILQPDFLNTNYEKLKHLLYSEETLYKLSAEYWVKKIKSKT